MNWLKQIFNKSNTEQTLQTYIGELKQTNLKLDSSNINLTEENKRLIEDNHNKDIEILKLINQLELSNVVSEQKPIKEEFKPNLTKLQRKINNHYDKLEVKTFDNLLESLKPMKHKTLKKYVWDLKHKGLNLILDEDN